jgi:hypothetical protein
LITTLISKNQGLYIKEKPQNLLKGAKSLSLGGKNPQKHQNQLVNFVNNFSLSKPKELQRLLPLNFFWPLKSVKLGVKTL